MPTLLVLKGPLKGEEFKLSDGLNIIGRHATYCDIVLAHDAVSRRHAVIEVSKPGCYIEDMHSHNGTAVNGRRLAPGEAGRMELCDADLVEINGFQLIFYRNESTASTVLLVADEDGESSHSIVSSVQVQAQLDDSTLEYPTAKLRALLRVMDDLGNSVKADDVPQRTLLSLMGSFEQAQRGFILLREPSGDEFRAAAAMHRDGSTRRIRMSRTIVESVVRRRSAILTADATQDQRFSDSHSVSKMQLRSMMCAPLISRDGDVFGVIQLDASDGAARFLHPDLEVLAGIARHVGAVLENARLHDAALSAQKMRFERQFRNLVVGSIQGILIQREFRPLFVNDSWALYHGLGPGEVTRMESVLPLVHPDDVALVREHVLRLARGEAESAMFEYRGLRADRMPVWFENVMTAVEWNELPAIQSVIIDVTVRKEAELALKRAHGELEQRVAQRTADLSATNLKLQDEIHERTLAENNLRRSETLYQSLVETLPLGVARKDLEGRYTFSNEGLAKLLKLAVGDIVGRTDEQLFSRVVADKHRRDDQTVVEFGSAMDFIERVDLPEAPARYLHTIRSPIRDTNGDVVAVQVIVSDITQLKQTEQELILYSEELERSNRELSQFASVVSHDLTAPLRAITSYGQLLVRRYQGKLDDEADEFIGYIVGGASRMQTLINDLQAYARVTTRAKPSLPTDVSQVVRDAIANLETEISEAGAEVICEPLPIVHGDATQLLQVFQNLIGNALKYRGEQPPRVQITGFNAGHEWRFSVADNGIGVPEKDFERIFVIHQRLHTPDEYPGTGLGLALCKRIVERHGGRIWVESKVGQGSVFHFSLPVRTKCKRDAQAGSPPPQPVSETSVTGA